MTRHARQRLRGVFVVAGLSVALVGCDAGKPAQRVTGTPGSTASSAARSTANTSSASTTSSSAALSVPSLSEAGFSGPVKDSLTGRLDTTRPSDQLKGEGTKAGTYTIQVSCQGAPLTVTASESRSLRPTVSSTFECDAPGSASHTARSTQAFVVHSAPLVTSVSSRGVTQFLVAAVEGEHVITAQP